MSGYKRYSLQEVHYIEDNYRKIPLGQISKHLGRSCRAIEQYIEVHDLESKYQNYVERYIAVNYSPHKGYALKLSKALGITPVKVRRIVLKLRKAGIIRVSYGNMNKGNTGNCI